MKKLTQILVVLCIPVLMWNCEKEVKYNRIEGTLSPGLEISQADLKSVPLVIVKIWDTVDFESVAIDPANFEGSRATMSDADGYFHFDSLPDGSYLVAAGEGFKFADADYAKISASNGSVNQVNKTVNRMALPNGPENYWVRVYNDTPFDITNIEFLVNGILMTSFPMILEPRGTDAERSGSFDIVLDPDQYNEFRVTIARNDTIGATRYLPFFLSWDSYILRYKKWIYEKQYDQDVYIKKQWFFGHYIAVYGEVDPICFLN